MLELAHCLVDVSILAAVVQAAKGEVVVQGEHIADRVKAFGVETGLAEGGGSPQVTHHVEVGRDLFHRGVNDHVVHEVDVGEAIGGGGRLDQGGGHGEPLVALHWHDHLVDVEQDDEHESTEVPVKAVVVRNHLTLAFLHHLKD